MADRLTADGFAVLTADLFEHDQEYAQLDTADIAAAVRISRLAGGAEALAALPRHRCDGIQRAEEWRSRVAASSDAYYPRAAELLCELRGRGEVLPGSVGAVGFSMGGRLVWRLALDHPWLKAAVVYYGRVPPLRQPMTAGGRVLGHYATDDEQVTAAAPEFADRYRAAGGNFEYHIYDGAEHGFFNEDRPEYSADAARLSWERTITFLAAELSAASPERTEAAGKEQTGGSSQSAEMA